MSLSRYPRYPAYKDSGVEWLGEVPAHWEVRRLKEFSTIQLSNVDKKSVDGERPVLLCNYTDVYYNDRITASLEFMEATASEVQVHRFTLQKHDVLITKDSESWSDIAVPAVVADDLPGVLCGYHLAHIRPEDTCFGPFLARAFTAVGPRDQFQLAANGITRFGLGSEAIATGLFALPPREEQERICQFLDRETARIDALIDKKRKLIELLQEQRAAIITRAVTRGLDPHAPMKDSGVEWLGEIPANWEVKRIKFLAKVGNGSTPNRDEPEYWNGDYPWLNSSVVNRDEVVSGADFVTARALRECHLPIIQPPAVLMGITGEGRTRGMASVLRLEATISQHVAAIHQPKSGVSVDYVRYVLVAAYRYLRELSSGAGGTKAALTCVQLGDFEIPLPLLEVQHEIVADLRSRLSSIDKVGQCIASAIAALSELRSSLITAAVTGAIDVRASLDADARIDAA